MCATCRLDQNNRLPARPHKRPRHRAKRAHPRASHALTARTGGLDHVHPALHKPRFRHPRHVQTITSATKSIDFAAYSLNDPEIIAALGARATAGVTIRLYHDRTELEAMARGDALLSHAPLRTLLNVPNVAIKVKHSSILMHLKSYLVDGFMLRDGSANFSPAGEEEQDNKRTILTDDATAVALFAAKFTAMWNRNDNLTVLQAVSSTHTTAARPAHRQ